MGLLFNALFFNLSISQFLFFNGISIFGLLGSLPNTERKFAFNEFRLFPDSNFSDSARESLASAIETSVIVTSPISNCSFVNSNCLLRTSTFLFLRIKFELSVAKSAYNFIPSRKTSCSIFLK